jgi:type II secretory pathway component PulF
LPIGDAIHVLRQRLTDPALRDLASALWNDLSEGVSLANAMKKFPKIFGDSIIYPIEAGEATGNLSPILRDILEHLKSQEELKKKVYGGLAYPVFVCSIAFGVVCLFLFWLLPRIQAMLASLGGTMTLPARLLIAGSNFTIKGGPFVLIAAVVGVVLLTRWRKTEKGRVEFDRMLLKIPFIKDIVLAAEVAKASNLMATLLGSGVNSTEAMRLTERALQNRWMRASFQEARQKINDGMSFSSAFKKHPFFPELAQDIIAVSESTGNIAKSFEEVYRI